MSIRFEFDRAKSKANKEKHGIDFEEAQELWEDNKRVEGPGKTRGEQRFVVVGRIHNEIWTAVITYRHENIRIISVRRARPKEIKAYKTEQD